MRIVFRIILWFILAIALVLGGLILYASLTNFQPDEVITSDVPGIPDVLAGDLQLDLLIWNIGYCGLDASMDFFYDGGQQVRPPESNVRRNLSEVLSFLSMNDSMEFILLQEVDLNSKRSYHINQYDSISHRLRDFTSFQGMNYDVFFVPLPFSNPMGKVESGLQTLTRFNPSVVSRHSFPGNYAWPKSLFMLDRCFLVTRFPLENGKELLVINTHNSAYDDGSLRRMQMEYLKAFLEDEYSRGNYIIVGGDWNQSPPGFPKRFDDQVFDDKDYSGIPDGYLPVDWQWAWDGSFPTNRRVITPYTRGETPTTLIDFFLLSPNIRMSAVKTIDLDFSHSDHNPVAIRIELNAGDAK